jgi:hypothetical protein
VTDGIEVNFSAASGITLYTFALGQRTDLLDQF